MGGEQDRIEPRTKTSSGAQPRQILQGSQECLFEEGVAFTIVSRQPTGRSASSIMNWAKELQKSLAEQVIMHALRLLIRRGPGYRTSEALGWSQKKADTR